LSLLCLPQEQERIVAPQLSETAAWAASHDAEIFETLVAANPVVMLRSDVLSSTEGHRTSLVDACLSACAQGSIHYREWGRDRDYRKLDHPGLAEQVRPWIIDKGRPAAARIAALDILRASPKLLLEQELVSISLDPGDDERVRSDALRSLSQHAETLGDASRRGLVPLALGDAGADEDDELRGLALPIVWPRALGTEEMVASLILPRNTSLLGAAYHSFLTDKLVAALSKDHLAAAIRGFAGRVREFAARDAIARMPVEELAGRLIVRGCQAIEDDAACEATAALVDAVAGAWWEPSLDQLHESALLESDTTRRRLAAAMVAALSSSERSYDVRRGARLRQADLSWALSSLVDAASDTEKRAWSSIVFSLWGGDEAGYELIYPVALREPVLHERFSLWIDGIPLDSKVAADCRAAHELRPTMERESEAADRLDSEGFQRLAEALLTDIADGDAGRCCNRWTNIVHLLQDRPTDASADDVSLDDLTRLPGYACLGPGLQARLPAAARAYLEQRDPGTNAEGSWWAEPQGPSLRARFGVLALALLEKRSTADLDALGPDIWARWAPAVLCDPAPDRDGALFRTCLGQARKATLQALRERLAVMIEGKSGIGFAEILRDYWDEEIGAIVAEAASDPRIIPDALASAIGVLVEHRHPSAHRLIETTTTRDTGDGSTIARAAALLAAGLSAAFEQHWPTLKIVMRRDPQLAKAVILRQCDAVMDEPIDRFASLPVDELAELYLFLASHFPEGDGIANGWVTPEHHVQRLRDLIPARLAERGTSEAVAALEQLASELPASAKLLGRHIVDARNALRTKSWIAPAPAAVLELAARSGNRLVRSDLELQVAILAALEDLQAELQGANPLARLLWDKTTPKDENLVSDYVKHEIHSRLSATGAIANREVEIRAPGSADQGQRTDILVQAYKRPSGRVPEERIATVVVEVKGCWHSKLYNAMETQLRDRYLAGGGYRCGIYLVGWFVCDRWNNAEVAARKAYADDTIESVRARLDQQALDLSGPNRTLRAFVLDARIR